MTYQCDKCGACCRQLIIEIEELDIVREPRLSIAEPFRVPLGVRLLDGDGNEHQEVITGYGAGAMLACGSSKPCPMLEGNLCAIYPTRPTCCVAFRAGSDQCQDARKSAGLEPLYPAVSSGGLFE